MRGCLIITLDPPYIAFSEDAQSTTNKRYPGRRSNHDEIKKLLQDRGVNIVGKWPIAEYVARIPCNLSDDELKKLNLS